MTAEQTNQGSTGVPQVPTSDEDLTILEQEIPGISQDTVDKWKEQYGTFFVTWFLGTPYVYRGFTWTEFLEVQQAQQAEAQKTGQAPTDFDLKLRMLKKCVMWPKDFTEKLEAPNANIPGGLPLVLGESILVASGFADLTPDVISKDDTPIDRLQSAIDRGVNNGTESTT